MRREALGRFTCSNSVTTDRFQVQVWKGLLAKTMKTPIAHFPKALMFHRLQGMMDLAGALTLNGAGNRLAVGAHTAEAADGTQTSSGAVFLFSFSDNAFSEAALAGHVWKRIFRGQKF